VSAARAAGKRAGLKDIRAIDPNLVEREPWLLTGRVVRPLGKGKRVLLAEDGGAYRVSRWTKWR
jgi:hypothetical protein